MADLFTDNLGYAPVALQGEPVPSISNPLGGPIDELDMPQQAVAAGPAPSSRPRVARSFEESMAMLEKSTAAKNPFYGSGYTTPNTANYSEARKYLGEDQGYIFGADNDDYYAQRQGTLETLGKGLLSLVPLTVAKTGQGLGFVGSLFNPANMFSDEGYFASATDNAFSNAFASMEDKMKNEWGAFKTFQEAEDREKGFWRRAFTDANFWSDEAMDGIAFMASAYLPGTALSKLNMGMKIAKGLSRFGIGAEAAGAAIEGLETVPNYLKNAQAFATKFDKGVTWATATASEAMMEAKGVKDNLIKSLENSGLSEEEKKDIIGTNTKNTFLMNAALLGFTNFMELKYLYKTFGKAEGVAGNISQSKLGDVFQTAAVAPAVGRLDKFLQSPAKTFLNGVAGGVAREGFVEENAQLAIQRFNEQNGAAGQVTSFFDIAGVGNQYIKQTAAAILGEDPETSVSIGLGGLLGGGPGGVGSVRQAKVDKVTTESAVAALNMSQQNWLKFGNIYKTAPVEKIGADGKPVVENQIVLDANKNPIVDNEKLNAITGNFKANVDLLDEAEKSNDNLKKTVLRDKAFANFVSAHVSAGIESDLFAKLDSAMAAKPEDLINLGFDPSQDYKQQIQEYKELASDIIKQNKLIENSILLDGSQEDNTRKGLLLDMAATQSVYKKLANQVNKEGVEIRNEFAKSNTTSLSDSLVDQLNNLQFRIDSMKEVITEREKLKNPTPLRNQLYKDVLAELEEAKQDLLKQNETTVASLKKKGDFYKYEKKDREKDPLAKAYTDKLKLQGQIENEVRVDALQIGKLADARNGKNNFQTYITEAVVPAANEALKAAERERNKPDLSQIANTKDTKEEEVDDDGYTVDFDSPEGPQTMELYENSVFIKKVGKKTNVLKIGKFEEDGFKVSVNLDGKEVTLESSIVAATIYLEKWELQQKKKSVKGTSTERKTKKEEGDDYTKTNEEGDDIETNESDDAIIDGQDTTKLYDRGPKWEDVKFRKTISLEFLDENDTMLNTREGTDRFHRFVNKHNLANRYYELQVITKYNDPFADENGKNGIIPKNYPDTIKVAVVKGRKLDDGTIEYDYVDEDNNIIPADEATPDNIVYTAIPDMNEWTVDRVKAQYTVDKLTLDEEIQQDINKQAEWQADVIERTKGEEDVFLKVVRTSPGVTRIEYTSATDENGKRQMAQNSLVGRLVSDDPDWADLRSISNTDNNIALRVTTAKNSIPGIKAGHLVMQEYNYDNGGNKRWGDKVTKVFNRKLSEKEKDLVINALVRLSELMVKKHGTKSFNRGKSKKLEAAEQAEENRILSFLKGTINWSQPTKKQDAAKHFWIDSGLHFGKDVIKFLKKDILANKEKILKNVYHNVNNTMLTQNSSFTELKFAFGKAEAGKVYDTYEQYLLQEKSPSEPPVVYTSMPLYDSEVPQRTGVYILWKDEAKDAASADEELEEEEQELQHRKLKIPQVDKDIDDFVAGIKKTITIQNAKLRMQTEDDGEVVVTITTSKGRVKTSVFSSLEELQDKMADFIRDIKYYTGYRYGTVSAISDELIKRIRDNKKKKLAEKKKDESKKAPSAGRNNLNDQAYIESLFQQQADGKPLSSFTVKEQSLLNNPIFKIQYRNIKPSKAAGKTAAVPPPAGNKTSSKKSNGVIPGPFANMKEAVNNALLDGGYLKTSIIDLDGNVLEVQVAATEITEKKKSELYTQIIKQVQDASEDEAFRLAFTEDVTKFEDFKELEEFMKNNLPQFSINRMSHLINGKAWGAFKNDALYIYEKAAYGTGFHEAFEGVWKHYLTDQEQNELVAEFRSREGTFTNIFSKETKNYADASVYDVREMLAEGLIDYIENDGANIKNQPKALNFFQKFWNFIKRLFGMSVEQLDELDGKINQIYKKVVTGGFADVKSIRETNLAETENRMVPGFTQKETSEIMDGLVYNFFLELYKEGSNIDTLFNSMTKEESNGMLRTLYSKAYNSVSSNLNLLSPKYNTIFTKQKDIVYDQFRKQLARFGAVFSEVEVDEDNVTDPLGIKDSLSVNPKSLTSTNIMMLISSLPYNVYSKSSKSYKVARNSMNQQRLVDASRVQTLLLNELSNIVPYYDSKGDKVDTFVQMMETLDKKYKNSEGLYKNGYAWILKLQQRLKYIDAAGKRIPYTQLTQDDILLRVAFAKSFSNIKYQPEKLIVSQEGNIYSINPLANKNQDRIRREWANQLKIAVQNKTNKLFKLSVNGDLVINEESAEFIDIANYLDNPREFRDENNDIDLYTVFNALEPLGITFTADPEELSEYAMSLYENTIQILNQIVEGNIKTAADIFNGNIIEERMKYLASVESVFDAEDNVLTYLNGDGEMQYSVGISSLYGNMVNILNTVKSQRELIETCPWLGYVKNDKVYLYPYQQNSELLKANGTLFGKDGKRKPGKMQYHVLAGTGVSDLDGVNTSKLQFPERVAFKIHYLLDNVGFSIINSDKNQEFGIGIPQKNTVYTNINVIQKFLSGQDVQGESNNFITKYLNHLADEMAAAEEHYKDPINIQYYQDNVADLGHFKDIVGEGIVNRFKDEVLEKQEYTIKEFIEEYESDIVEKITDHVNTQIDRTVELFNREDIFYEPAIPGMFFKNGKKQTQDQVYRLTDAIDNDKLNKLLNLGEGGSQMLSFAKQDGKYADYVERVGYTKSDIRALAAYVNINEEMLAAEQHKMIYGHPAMYKDLPKRANGATSTKEPVIEDTEVISWMDENMNRHDGKRRSSTKHQTFKNISFQDVDVVSLFHKEKAEAMYADLLENNVAPALAAKRVGGIFDKEGKLTGYKLDKKGDFTGALAGYLKMTEADAMAFILPDMLRDLLFLSSKFDHRRDAQWNYNMAYEKLVRSGRIKNQAGETIRKTDSRYKSYGAPELDVAEEIYNQGDPGYQFEVLKTQYFGYVNTDNVTHPTFLKHSVQPKFYKDVEGTQFEKLYLAAQKNQVDVIGFESGQKIGNVTKDNGKFVPVYDQNGGINIPTVDGQYELPSEMPQQDLYTRFYGIQVEQNSKPKKFTARGSQITKVVMSNFYENGEPVKGDAKLKKLIENYHRTVELMSQQGKEELLKELGLKKVGKNYKVTDLSKLVNLLREEAESRDMPDNVIDAINAITLPDGSQELQYQFDTLINRDKIDYILNNLVDSRVIAPKIHGKSSVQVASTLYETNARDFVYLKDGLYQSATKSEIAKMTDEQRSKLRLTSNNLKFYSNDKGKITGMETYISWPFGEVTPEELGLKLTNGVYLIPEGGIPGIDNQLLKAIGFRIPTQAPSSIESIIIKGFTPASNGDMIVVPSEIVGKAGSDFDIDKINLYLPVFRIDHNQYGTQPFKDFIVVYLVRKEGQNKSVATRWMNKLTVSDIELINQATFTAVGKEYHQAANSLQDLEGKIADVPNSQLKIIKNGIQQFNKQYRGKKRIAYIAPDTSTPAGLQNKFMELTLELINHPLNYGQLITPNSTANLKGLATEISARKIAAGTKLKENEKSYTYLRSFVGSVLTRERYLTAKRMVGIAALHTTFHTMAQQAGTKINGEFKMGSLYYLMPKKQTTKDKKTETKMISAYEPISIKLDHKKADKNNTYSIGHISDTEGIKISDSFNEATSGFVDGAKDPFVFDLNFSLQSTSTWFYLKHHGVPERHVAYFMNQPIIDQYLAIQAKNKSSFKKINDEQLTREEMMYEAIAPWYKMITGQDILAILEVNKNTAKEFGIKNDVITLLMEIYNGVDTFDIDDLETAISKGKKADPQTQLAVLMSYLRYEAQATKVTDYIISIGYDTKKTKTVQETKQQLFRWNRMTEAGFIQNPDAIMDKTFLGEMKKQKEDIPNMFQNFFITLSPEIQKVFQPLYEKLQNPEYFITMDDASILLNRYQNHVLNYILHTTKFKDVDGNEKMLNQMYKSMFVGDESMAARLYKIRESDDPEVADNLFVRELLPIITDGKSKTNNISLLRNRMDTYDINNIIEALNDLRNYGKKIADKELVKFTDDITKFSILQSGVQTSSIDFKKVLSTELYSELTKTILDTFKKKPNLDVMQVYRTFHQNNWNNRTIVSKAPSWIKVENDAMAINVFSSAAQKDFYIKYVRNPKYQNQKIKDLKEKGLGKDIWVPRLFQRTEYTDASGLKILYYPIDMLGDGRNFTEIYTDVETASVLPKNNLGDKTAKDTTVLNGTGRWSNLQEGMLRRMSERYGQSTYLGGKNSYDAAGKRRFSPEGKMTPMGDGKDQAMRKAADSVIVEMADDSSYSVGEETYKVSSDMLGRNPQETALIQVSAKNGGVITKKGVTYSSMQEVPNVVMISRVLEFKTRTGLMVKTKQMIQDAIARNEDVVFILGDVQNLDSPIVEYLQSIGATYNLYYTGDAPRIAPVKTDPATSKPSTNTVFEELIKKANAKPAKKTEEKDSDAPVTYTVYQKAALEMNKKPMVRPLFEKLTPLAKKELLKQIKTC